MTVTSPTKAQTSASAAWSTIPTSSIARNTLNPIRVVVEKMQASRAAHTKGGSSSLDGPTQTPISLSIGDPTVFGNFNTHPEVTKAVRKQLDSYRANGYGPSYGLPVAREALALKYSTPEAPLSANDVILTSSCSSALEMTVSCLADVGQNILIPRPGFSMYKTLALSKQLEAREYRLLPERQWEIDLDHFASLIDDRTAAVILNNPSNPCGSVFSRSHLEAILAICEHKRVPIISDEIYADMVFDCPSTEGVESEDTHSPRTTGTTTTANNTTVNNTRTAATTTTTTDTSNQFHALAQLTHTVPILTVGGLAKQWLVPGWRVGWILIHDRQQLFSQVRRGLEALSTLILGPNTVIQAAIPDIMTKVPPSFLADTIRRLSIHARACERRLSQIPGLQVVVPQGAMYMMIGLDIPNFTGIQDDVDFASRLNLEESVEVLPGQCFNYPNFFRIVLTPPVDKLEEACNRIARFCNRYYMQ
ncbi:hypothetical protein H4R33_005620 [Dimargaris cristalligena]|nr:hypothetical protein H4R33_005620 [Dimargaris cristalligena]